MVKVQRIFKSLDFFHTKLLGYRYRGIPGNITRKYQEKESKW